MRSPFAAFRVTLCLSTALMMAISWPLWVSGGLFPRVPFVGGLQTIPVWASWVRLGLSIAAMLAAAFGFRWRALVGLAAALMAWMVLEDQLRLQPWMYQFLLMGFAIAACPEVQAAGLCRVFLIALYLHSGLSKLDVAFVTGLGQTFLETLTGLVGMSPAAWPARGSIGAIWLMPAWEILVALGLVFPHTRRFAVAGAVIQHGVLLLILGPLGLAHSTNVLLWNLAIASEVVVLFGWGHPPTIEEPIAGRFRLAPLARYAILLAATMPFVERFGLWDTWPSFALYSSHDEKAEFLVSADDLAGFPEEIRRHFSQRGSLRLLFWNRWSLAERRAPVYPQGRTLNGVAEALAARYRGIRPAYLAQSSRAEAMSGARIEKSLTGPEEIRRHGDSYLLNAHPVP